MLPVPQPRSPGRLVASRLINADDGTGVLGSAASPLAHTVPPDYQPAPQAGTFLSLVVTDKAFLILPLSSGLEHQRRWSGAFSYPLASPFRYREAGTASFSPRLSLDISDKRAGGFPVWVCCRGKLE